MGNLYNVNLGGEIFCQGGLNTIGNINTSGSTSVSGIANLNDLVMNNAVSGYNSTHLNYYEKTTFNMVMDTPAGSTYSWILDITKIGKICKINSGSISVTQGSTPSHFSTTSGNSLPTRFIPLIDAGSTSYFLTLTKNDTTYNYSQMIINNSGFIDIYASSEKEEFNKSGKLAIVFPVSIIYQTS